MKVGVFGAMLAMACLHTPRAAVAQQPRAATGEEQGTSNVEATSSAEGAAEPAEAAARARERFAQGTRWAREGNWPQAVAAYESAYRLYPHATTLYNIGFCQMQLGDLVAAWQSTARALDPGAHDPARRLSSERRGVAEQQGDLLKERLPSVTVVGPPGLSIRVGSRPLLEAGVAEPGSFIVDRKSDGDGARTVARRTRIYVNPGQHSVSLALESAPPPQHHSVALAEGAQVTLHWLAAPEPAVDPPAEARAPASGSRPPAAASDGPAPSRSPDGSRRSDSDSSFGHEEKAGPSVIDTAKLGSFVIAAGGLGLALASGIVALSTDAHLDSVCPTPNTCPRAERGAVERYRTSVKLTNVGLITGFSAAAVGLSLTLFGGGDRAPSPSVSATAGGVQLVHAF